MQIDFSGVFTVAGIVDSAIYNTHRIAQKIQMGKQS